MFVPWWKSVPKNTWGHAKKPRISPKNKNQPKKLEKRELILQNSGIEPPTSCMAAQCANHYTTETDVQTREFLINCL